MITFSAQEWGAPIEVINEKGVRRTAGRLRNWYCADKGRQVLGFSWGDTDEECMATSYSVLRELYGKRAAERHAPWLLEKIIAFISPDESFRLTQQGIEAALRERKAGRVPKVLLEDEGTRQSALEELEKASKRFLEEARLWQTRMESSRRE